MGQKVIIRFWWESGLSSALSNHFTTFCRPFRLAPTTHVWDCVPR